MNQRFLIQQAQQLQAKLAKAQEELNNVTVHFFQEEWEEFLELTRILK